MCVLCVLLVLFFVFLLFYSTKIVGIIFIIFGLHWIFFSCKLNFYTKAYEYLNQYFVSLLSIIITQLIIKLPILSRASLVLSIKKLNSYFQLHEIFFSPVHWWVTSISRTNFSFKGIIFCNHNFVLFFHFYIHS